MSRYIYLHAKAHVSKDKLLIFLPCYLPKRHCKMILTREQKLSNTSRAGRSLYGISSKPGIKGPNPS